MRNLSTWLLLALSVSIAACGGGGGGGGGGGKKKVRPLAVTAPGKPVVLAAAGDGQIVLSWAPPSTGSAASSFKIFRGESDDLAPDGDPLATEESDASQYVDTDLVNYKPYYYVVVAANEKGDGPPSNVATATPEANLPGMPGGFAAAAADASVVLAWSAPESGGALTEYHVYRAALQGDVGVEGALLQSTSASATGYTDSEVSNFAVYWYGVRASNPTGEGPFSAILSAMPNNGAPGTPQNVTAVSSDGQVTLTWGTPAGGTAQEYRVFRGTESGFSLGDPMATVSGDTLEFDDTGLTNFQTYYYRVQAANVVDASQVSNEVSAMPNNGPPGTPQNVVATPGNHQVSLTWEAPSGGTVYEYRLYRGTATGFSLGDPLTTLSSDNLAYTDTGLTNYQDYFYRIQAANPVQAGTASDEVTAWPNDGPPGQPLSLASASGDGSITLTWTAPADGGVPQQYRVYRSSTSTVNVTGTAYATVSVPTVTFQDTGLTNFSTFYYAVVAVNPVGPGTSTAAISEMAGLVPGAPAGLGVISGNAAISLSWQAPTGGGAVSGYNVFRDTLPNVSITGVPHASTAAGTTSFGESGLTNNQAYFYRVTAQNPKGTGTSSDEVTGFPRTPNAEVPSDPPSVAPVDGEIGRSVAISGNHAVISLPAYDHTASTTNTGAVFFYERDQAGGWSQVGFAEKPGVGALFNNAQFGYSVAVSGDVALIGTPAEVHSVTSAANAGRVSIFRRQTTGTWTWERDLEEPTGAAGAQFGFSVAISGNVILIGARTIGSLAATGGTATTTGTVYPYEYIEGNWIAKSPIQPPTGQCTAAQCTSMQFGYSVAVSGDLAVIGAINEKTGTALTGSAWFFHRDSGTGQWSWITAGGGKYQFATTGDVLTGSAVSISGTWAAVGTPSGSCTSTECPTGNRTNVGGITFFEYNGSAWVNRGKVFSPSRATGRKFGVSVALTPTRAVVVSVGSGTTTPHTVEACTRAGSAWSCAATPMFTAPVSGSIFLTPTPAVAVTLAVAVDGDNTLIGNAFADGAAGETFTGDFTFR